MYPSIIIPVTFSLFLTATLTSTIPAPNAYPQYDETICHGRSHAAVQQQQPISASSSSCTTKTPSSHQKILQSSPSSSYPQNNQFTVSQSAGGSSNINTLVAFTGIPSGSYGCQISISIAPNYPISSSGNAQLNVYALPNAISESDTYATYFPKGGRGPPQGAYLWATTTVTPGQKTVLNSATCRPDLGFLFEIASESQAGSVSFADAATGGGASGINGFYLTYNC